MYRAIAVPESRFPILKQFRAIFLINDDKFYYVNKNLWLLNYCELRYKLEQNREVNIHQIIQTSNNIHTNSNDILYSNGTLTLFSRDSNIKWDSILE